MNQLSLNLSVEFSPRRLIVRAGTSDDDFRKVCGLVLQCQESAGFWMRDLLTEAYARWGDAAVRELAALGFHEKALAQARALAGMAQISERLSLEQHLAIAKAPPERQMEWMAIAQEAEEAGNGFSVPELKRIVKTGSIVREEEGSGSAAGNFRFATIEGVAAQFALWERAVEKYLKTLPPGWRELVKKRTAAMYATLRKIHEEAA